MGMAHGIITVKDINEMKRSKNKDTSWGFFEV